MENNGKINLTPGTILGPLPAALVSCGTFEKPNIITVAWTGIVNSKPPMCYISVRPERFSHGLISERREFVINIPTVSMAKRVDLCGMKSGRNGDKFKICGFTKTKAGSLDDCPVIAECPVNIECRVKEITKLGSHDMFLAEITGLTVDSSLVDESGKLDLSKAGIVGYLHGEYVPLGKKRGSFGFSVRKKNK